MPDMTATFLGVELRTWITGGAIVLLVAIAHVALGWWTRRRERKNRDKPLAPGESGTTRYWIARGLSDAVPPIAFMLWLHGLHLALTTLVVDYPETAWITRGVVVLNWLRGAGTLLGLAWLLSRFARTIDSLLRSFATRSEAGWDDVMLPFAGKSLRLVLPMLAPILGTPALVVSADPESLIQNAVSLLLVGTIAVILIQFVNAMAQLVLRRYRMDVADNRRARGVYTQVTVLKKIAITVIVLFAIASMLMVFDSVRQLGTAMEHLFVIQDLHNFGTYYDYTLQAWFENFHRNWGQLEATYGERFYRMWKYYLLSTAGGFRARHNQLWQLVLSKKGLLKGYESVR